MRDQNKKHWNIILGYLILIVVGTSTSVAGIYLIQKINRSEKSEIIEKAVQPSDFPDYDAIKGKNPDSKIQVVRFTDGCPEGGCVNNKSAVVEFDGIKNDYKVVGSIKRAYLYIEAAVDYNRPLSNYDTFYFALKYQGGHLSTKDNLLSVPPSDISRYLYDLRSISYLYKGKVNKEYKNVNFLNLLQTNSTFNIHTAVSSDRPGRVLKEVSIYYQCLDGTTCSIDKIK